MSLLGGLIGESPGLAAVRTQVEQLLRRQSGSRRLPPVLILGETGTGKGLLGRALHEAGPRRAAAFVSVNCAAIPETLLEAELFGYERGAFTDARQGKLGLFQTAHGGTLFLDEIGLLPHNLQAKLLTALEDRAVRRLGSTRIEPADVWIISATSEDLKAGARRRGFREELYHRLAVVTLRLPPLRERGRDILTLAQHFLARTCSDYGLTSKTLAEDARVALLSYRWPGNVRELGNVMERAALLVDGPLVTADGLDLAAPRTHRVSTRADEERPPGDAPADIPLGQTIEEIERRYILEALHETRWNISRAANRLGLTRNVMRYRVQKYGLRLPSSSEEPTERPDGVGNAVKPTTGDGQPKVRWERRHLAMLRVDLETTGPTGIVSTGAPGQEALVEKIESFGGRIEEVSPEGLLAMYGLEPIEDAPRRAAHTALAIQKLAARTDGAFADLVGVRVGLHVGEFLVARVGNTPRVDHSGKREAWRQLEGLMGGAQPGSVLVSAPARPFLERRFVLVPCAVASRESEGVYRLEGLERTGLGLGDRLTPFVARERELEHLNQALEQARTGHGQAIGIVGEPGVGKSRLLWEFIESQRNRGSQILITTAPSYGRQTPYLPVIDLLKAYFKIEPRDEADQLRERVTAKVLELESTLAPALPALLALLDVPVPDAHWKDLHPEHKRRQTLEAVKLLLLEESRRQPIIAVFEDLHWLDSETQAVLDSMVESLPSHRVLLLSSFRPEYGHRWSSKTYYAQLRLDPLSPADSRIFLDGLVACDEATNALKTSLIEHTEGNPFFLEESVRMLVETGALTGDRGSYRLAQPAGELQVPATIQAVVTARADRLPPEDRALLQTASVIGRDVPFVLLQRVADLPEELLRAGLMRLQQGEFLYETRLVPESEYGFKHAITHEVAYRGLLQNERRVLHARILTAIEQLYANRLSEQVDRLAHHAFRGEVWDKASFYAREAGAQAAARSVYREAVTRFEQALESLKHSSESRETIEQRIDLVLNLRNSLQALGEFPRLFEYLCEAKILAGRIGDQRRLGWISAFMAHRYWQLSNLDSAVESCDRALVIAASGDFGLRIVASYQLGLAYLSRGDLARAKECLLSNIEALQGDLIGERFGEAYLPSVQARVWLLHVLAARGEFPEGIARGEEAVQIAQTEDDPFSLVAAHRGLGFLYLRKGDLDDSIRCLERSLELGREWNIRNFWSGTFSYLGYAYALSGRLTDGLSSSERGLEQRTAIGELSGHAEALALLSEVYRLDQSTGRCDPGR